MSDLIRNANSNFYTYHAGDLWQSDPNRLPLRSYPRPRLNILRRFIERRSARNRDRLVDRAILRTAEAYGGANEAR